jgi:hypothetical protein
LLAIRERESVPAIPTDGEQANCDSLIEHFYPGAYQIDRRFVAKVM